MNLEEFEQIISKYGYKPDISLKQCIEEDDGYLPNDLRYINNSPYSIIIDISSNKSENAYNIQPFEIDVYRINFESIFTDKNNIENTIILNNVYGYPLSYLNKCLQITANPIEHYCFILNEHVKAIQFFNRKVLPKLINLDCNLNWIKATTTADNLNTCNSDLCVEYVEFGGKNTLTIKTDIVTGLSKLILDIVSCDVTLEEFILNEKEFNFDKLNEFIESEKIFIEDYKSAKVNISSKELINKINNSEFNRLYDLEMSIFNKQLRHKIYITSESYNATLGYTFYKCNDGLVKVSGVINNTFIENTFKYKAELV